VGINVKAVILFRLCKRFQMLYILLIALLLIPILAGCVQAKKSITAEDFRTTMEGMGYNVSDTSEEYAEDDFIQTCVGFVDAGLQVSFFEIDATDNAFEYYLLKKAFLADKKGNDFHDGSYQAKSQSEYKLKTSKHYYYVAQVKTTVIYSECPISEATRLDDIIKAIGY